jgi:hypothetical protein
LSILGPDVSNEFSLYEGQKVEISCTGNIDFNSEKDSKVNDLKSLDSEPYSI